MDTPVSAGNPDNSAGGATATADTVSDALPGATQGQPANPDAAVQTPAAPEMLTVMGQQIEASKVPPEFREKLTGWNKAYTETSQRASELDKKAQALDQLTKHDGFRKWYADQLNPQPKAPEPSKFELTPEKQAELLSDPAKMQGYIEGLTMDVINRVALPAAKQAQMEARTLRNEQEISRLAERHPDFDDLNKNGKIEEIVAGYAQRGAEIPLEDAYWLAKRPFMESEAHVKAQQRVQEKVGASTLAPAGATPTGIKVLPGKGLSMSEKFKLAAAATMRGEKVQFDPNK